MSRVGEPLTVYRCVICPRIDDFMPVEECEDCEWRGDTEEPSCCYERFYYEDDFVLYETFI